MAWRDVVDGTELSIELEDRRPASLRIESGRFRRARLSLRGEGRLWFRLETWWSGVWILRAGEAHSPSIAPLNVVEPIRASEARAIRDSHGWMRWFAEALDRSTGSPIERGEWRLSPLVRRTRTPSERTRHLDPDVFFPSNPDGLPSPAYGASASVQVPRLHYLSWGINGSGDVIPLRDFSPLDAARVKSWRKHAREGTLPPVLVWWVNALDAYLILDGHDRLRAAVAEGVSPQLIALWQRQVNPSLIEPSVQEAFVRQYEKAFENGLISASAREEMNRRLGFHFEPWWPRTVTVAKAKRNLEAAWLEEVRAHGAGEDELDRMMHVEEQRRRRDARD